MGSAELWSCARIGHLAEVFSDFSAHAAVLLVPYCRHKAATQQHDVASADGNGVRSNCHAVHFSPWAQLLLVTDGITMLLPCRI